MDELGFGGWRVAWLELLNNNINPYSDFKALNFAGGKQQRVVLNVKDGKADAGSVRTDMLERMAAAGKIKLSDFKVISKKQQKIFLLCIARSCILSGYFQQQRLWIIILRQK